MAEIIPLKNLLREIQACTACQDLPLGPRPVLRAAANARILIVGQAPGTRVHETGIPWNDPSGVRLRHWLGVSDQQFYDAGLFAIIPMGFCYPGKGKSGDLPPRKRCAELWRAPLHAALPNIETTILAGQYAQQYYLADRFKTLTGTVKCWREFFPQFIPLPHPSPRNNLWLRKNPWFEQDVVPALREQVHRLCET